MSKGRGPTIIVRRGYRHKSGPEAVVDDLMRLRRAHNQEYREDRERRLRRAKTYEERLMAAQEARQKQYAIAEEAVARLDEYDW